ncbi:hypothetical protein [Billgrantia antri]|uniref:hypothetical protein n=1 Tax=Billgrantia antri TaxID=2846777 RepID=UPI003B212DEA
MELTIPVIQIAVVGIITFGAAIILKPLALVIRDYLLWVGIARYIKSSNFNRRAQRLASVKARYNEHIKKGDLRIELGEPETIYMGEKKASLEEFKREQEARDVLSERIHDNSKRINKELSIIGSLLRHFDQQERNPALDIVKRHERREFTRKGLEYNDV